MESVVVVDKAECSTAQDKRSQGNESFKKNDFRTALQLYTEAISESLQDSNALKAVLCNRAACYLKLGQYSECIDDCSAAIEIDMKYIKAYYRRAQAQIQLGDGTSASKDLQFILKLEPGNKESIALMREAAKLIQQKASEDSEVNRVIKYLEQGKDISNGLKMLISLCSDDVSHAMEFCRRHGHLWLADYISQHLSEGDNDPGLALSVRIMLALAQHPQIIKNYVIIANNSDDDAASVANVPLVDNDKFVFEAVVKLITTAGGNASRAATSLVLRTLQAWPQGDVIDLPEETDNADEGLPRVEEVDAEGNSLEPKCNNKQGTKKRGPQSQVVLYLKNAPVRLVCAAWLHVIKQNDVDAETYSLAMDALIAFVSDMKDYVTQEVAVDTRNESLEERRERIRKQRIYKSRSKTHAQCAIDCGGIESVISLLDDPIEAKRSRASSVLSRLIAATDNDEFLKEKCKPYIMYKWKPGSELVEEKYDPENAPPPGFCRRRAWLEACMLVTKPDIGIWALERPGGVHQLLMLAATPDILNQEAASEVFCLAASVENAAGMLQPVVSSGVLQLLLESPAADVRASSASTLTKLSLKAKALLPDSSETTHSMNIALSVLKNALAVQNKEKSDPTDPDHARLTTVSFSHLDDAHTGSKTKGGSSNVSAVSDHQWKKKSLASVERAVEVLAALAGKSTVKEELVHGSPRVASALNCLTNLVFDERSTASYGIAHILASLTVTNKELRDKALAEKDISPEQFQQLQELQRVKAKDEAGNPIEEKKEEEETDTIDLCRRRIQRIASAGGFQALLRLLEHTSTQTKLTAAKALRQMNVEPVVRGIFIQQGGLKTCHDIVVNEKEEREVRREAAHAMAKALVTTNPMMLSEHLRLSAFKPLIYLCRDTDSSNLMQFEGLLALTNLTSCGDRERDRFIADKGISVVHYLMFSDHLAVRRAATETLCNMSGTEALFKIMRIPDNIRLWVAFAEDWNNEENEEAIATALAASGTLAVAASDEGVGKALSKEGCASCILTLLGSNHDGLCHRGLVFAIEFIKSGGLEARNHLGEHGVVDALTELISSTSSSGNARLFELCKELAETMAEFDVNDHNK